MRAMSIAMRVVRWSSESERASSAAAVFFFWGRREVEEVYCAVVGM